MTAQTQIRKLTFCRSVKKCDNALIIDLDLSLGIILKIIVLHIGFRMISCPPACCAQYLPTVCALCFCSWAYRM